MNGSGSFLWILNKSKSFISNPSDRIFIKDEGALEKSVLWTKNDVVAN